MNDTHMATCNLTRAAADAARQLRSAYVSGPIAPLRTIFSATDVDVAYQIQALNAAHWQSEGRRIVGRKIGLTSPAVQRQLGVDRPDFGILFDDMIIAADGEVPRERLWQPKVEAEMAFVLDVDLMDPAVTLLDVIRACAYVLPALEIVDSRIANWDISLFDTIADNASCGMLVLGRTPILLDGLDLRGCGMLLEVNGRLVSHGVGAACMGHPLEAVVWLARELARRGNGLRAGEVILSGALGPMVGLEPNTHVRTVIAGLGELSVTVSPGNG